jgi:hypothetical protein
MGQATASSPHPAGGPLASVLGDADLAEFSRIVSFTKGSLLPDGRLLGPKDGSGWGYDDGSPDRARWSPLQWMRSQFDLSDKTVLEPGPAEGLWTLRLAAACRHVTSVEVRSQNVCALLVRLFVHGVRNVQVVLRDARSIDDAWVPRDSFDLLFHYGLLYHLDQPVEHLVRVARLARRLFLGTHFCRDDTRLKRADLTYAGRTWRAGRYAEHGWKDPLSGAGSFSRWLFRDDLLEAVAAGYERIQVVNEYVLKGNYPYLWLMAERA